MCEGVIKANSAYQKYTHTHSYIYRATYCSHSFRFYDSRRRKRDEIYKAGAGQAVEKWKLKEGGVAF